MLRIPVTALVIVAGVSLSANSASAVPLKKDMAVDSGGHRTRQEHVDYCQKTRRSCLGDIAPTLPRHPHAADDCVIAYEQCMDLWRANADHGKFDRRRNSADKR